MIGSNNFCFPEAAESADADLRKPRHFAFIEPLRVFPFFTDDSTALSQVILMFVLQPLTRVLAIGGIALGMTASLGCQQLSKTVRSESVRDESSPPTPPDFRNPTPTLEPVPQNSLELVPLPLPAPPSDAALREGPQRGFSDEPIWDGDEIEVADEDESEFFPDFPARNSQRDSIDRGQAASRRSIEGRSLAGGGNPQWPVIVPAAPELRHVAGHEPVLLPVPK
jgi:hypothetical protein